MGIDQQPTMQVRYVIQRRCTASWAQTNDWSDGTRMISPQGTEYRYIHRTPEPALEIVAKCRKHLDYQPQVEFRVVKRVSEQTVIG